MRVTPEIAQQQFEAFVIARLRAALYTLSKP